MLIHSRTQSHITKWDTGKTEIYDGVEYKPKEEIARTFLMLAMIHPKSQEDENGKRKPYRDIYNLIRETAQAAEDIDTKDFSLEPVLPKYYPLAFIVNRENEAWMEEVSWGETIDEFKATRSDFGYAWLKAERGNNSLNYHAVEWANFYPDIDDFENGDKVEKYPMNKADLIDTKGWEQDGIDILMAREEEVFDIFEFHGIASRKEYLDFNGEDWEDEDSFVFNDYVFIYTLIDTDSQDGEVSKKQDKDKDPIRLFSAKKTKPVYYGLKYGKNSRGELGVGLGKRTFEPQAWTNYYTLQEKKAMDLAGKVLLQTPKGNKAKGRNVDKMNSGTILEHTDGKPYTKLDLMPNAMANFGNNIESWKTTANEANSVFAANTGADLPSNQTLRGLVLQANQANSPHQQRREEMDLFFRKLYREDVIPFLVKRARKKDITEGSFSLEELRRIDADATEHYSSLKIFDKLVSGEYDDVSAEERWGIIADEKAFEISQGMKRLKKTKMSRFFSKGKFDYLFEDADDKLRLSITDERKDKRAFLANQQDIMNLLANPQIQANPQTRYALEELMQGVGISPLSIPDAPQATAPTQVPETSMGAEPQQ